MAVKNQSRDLTSAEEQEIRDYIKEHNPGAKSLTYGWMHETAVHFEEKFKMEIPDNRIGLILYSMAGKGEL